MCKPFPLLRLLALLVTCGAVIPCAHAGDMTAECPSVVKDDSLKPGTPLAGWQTVPTQQHLAGAGMMGGAPEMQAYLMPDKEDRPQGKQMFVFDKGDGQRWFWCLYGGMRLAKRLDDKATRCTITTKTKQPEKRLSAAVVCK